MFAKNFIDITLKGVTKGDAITELIEKLGIDKKDTYAFGDADNDVEMMQAVGTGIAMGRHSEKSRRSRIYGDRNCQRRRYMTKKLGCLR